MVKYEFYDHKRNLTLPNGKQLTPEEAGVQYPLTLRTDCVIDVSMGLDGGIYILPQLRAMYEIDPNLDDATALAAVNTAVNTVKETEPTAEERIAAALEFQNLMSM